MSDATLGWIIIIAGLAIGFFLMFYIPIKIFSYFHRDMERITGAKLSPFTTGLAYRNITLQNQLIRKELELKQMQIQERNQSR